MSGALQPWQNHCAALKDGTQGAGLAGRLPPRAGRRIGVLPVLRRCRIRRAVVVELPAFR
ncbi:MAG: hypothetical protein JWN43_10 [Gammaproteobacteria bacterium]|nr:hypothetical protein [Gammaproteobacteria bacterium]